MARTKRYQAVLFDLDGTVADTALDLAGALNRMLEQDGKLALPYSLLRPLASHGAAALLEAGYGIDNQHPSYPEMRERYLSTYLACLSVETKLFDGIDTVLEALEQQTIAWGIVTNKPEFLTTPLMQDLSLAKRSACTVSGDTCARPKPFPDSLLYACAHIEMSPSDVLYVGDADRDIEAGIAAGCDTVAALYGYIDDGDDPNTWGASYSIAKPTDLLELIC